MSEENKEKGIAPFNMAQDTQWMLENRAVAFPGGQQTVPPLVGKLHDCMQDLSYSLKQMSTADPRNRTEKFKPGVTPPRCRGSGNNYSRGSFNNRS